VIAIGGSAGSLPPLIRLVGGLPTEVAAAIVVTIHVGEQNRSQLPSILSRSGPLPASWAIDGEILERARVYVAPPGRHLLVVDGHAHLSSGPRVNRHRPAVDVMFASMAASAGERSVAVVLSGVLDDGAVGAALVARQGGSVLVQDDQEAEFSGMPTATLAAAPGARAVSSTELAPVVLDLLAQQAGAAAKTSVARGKEPEMNMADSKDPGFLSSDETGLTRLVCPECGGALAEVQLPQITYFRCHVGHQYAPQSLAAAQADAVEAKLWSAVAALEEQAAFQRYLGTTPTGDESSVGIRRAQAIADRAQNLREQVRRWTAEVRSADESSTEPSPGAGSVD
jgi:two-component system chemotaxis response regulator CheB